MNRKLFLVLSVLATLVAHVVSAERPNLINIVVDDLGYSDLGCYGGEAITPNIDHLAKSGYKFTDYRTYPKCFPTRDSLLSGHYAAPHGVLGNSATIGELLIEALHLHLGDEAIERMNKHSGRKRRSNH